MYLYTHKNFIYIEVRKGRMQNRQVCSVGGTDACGTVMAKTPAQLLWGFSLTLYFTGVSYGFP